eukprot:GSChrysophyteH2.ASY1.ANO1.516.1 assembled CDS
MDTNKDFLSFEDARAEYNPNGQEDYDDNEYDEGEEAALLTDVLAPWLSTPLPKGAPPLVRLHNEIISFCEHAKPSEADMIVRNELVDEIAAIVAEVWPTASLHVFGSMLTNILTPSSDIDVTVLDIPGVGTKDPLALMLELANKITSKNICTYIEAIQTAKVPIIKLDHRASGISVDICVMESSGLVTGALVKEMVATYPPMLPLTILLKQFLAQRRLNEPYTGGCGSFMLSLMVVSFLQHRQRVEQHHSLTMSWNLGSLLIEFLRLYGCGSFDYLTTGISVSEFGKYFNKTGRSDWNKGSGGNRNTMMLALENPHMPDIDMGRGSFMMPKIRRAFEHAQQLLGFALSDSTAKSYLSYFIRSDDPLLHMTKPTVSRKLNPSSLNPKAEADTDTDTDAEAAVIAPQSSEQVVIGGTPYNNDSDSSSDDSAVNRMKSSVLLNDDLGLDDDFGASSKGKKRKASSMTTTSSSTSGGEISDTSDREKKKLKKKKDKEKERKKRKKEKAKLQAQEAIDLTTDSD